LEQVAAQLAEQEQAAAQLAEQGEMAAEPHFHRIDTMASLMFLQRTKYNPEPPLPHILPGNIQDSDTRSQLHPDHFARLAFATGKPRLVDDNRHCCQQLSCLARRELAVETLRADNE